MESMTHPKSTSSLKSSVFKAIPKLFKAASTVAPALLYNEAFFIILSMIGEVDCSVSSGRLTIIFRSIALTESHDCLSECVMTTTLAYYGRSLYE